MVDLNEMIEDGKLVEAASVLYDVIMCIINEQSPQLSVTRENWKKVTPKLVEAFQDPSIVIPDPTEDPGDDIEILKDKAPLNITYLGPEENAEFKNPANVKKQIYVGATYKVVSPEVEGFTPDKAVVTGKMTAEGVDEIVTYSENEPAATAQLNITYVCPEGYVVPDGIIQDVEIGKPYSVESPTVEGCTPDKAVVTGTMVEGGVTETVTYTANPVETGNLLIMYFGPEDDPDFDTPDMVVEDIPVGQEFMIPSPEVEGYEPDKASVSGAMVAEGISEEVYYTKVPVMSSDNDVIVEEGEL